ncbi:MAG: acyl-protein synthetase [Alphaproteobacteria bacterium]|nr:acyl-protein synthetase [Alphaproteobacteria bacterium]
MIHFPSPLFTQPVFGLHQQAKDQTLFESLRNLTEHHKERCPAYRKIIDVAFPDHSKARSLNELPFLPVSLFKNRSLRSVATEDVRVTIKSSGTTGARKSQVQLDRETTQLSSQTLAAILRELVGEKRLPLLIVDTPHSLDPSMDMGARAAAILGLMPFGFDHTFILNDDLSMNETTLRGFLAKHGGSPFLVYGFTFLIWQTLIPTAQTRPIDLSNGTLLHSGGWKALADQAIDNERFKETLRATTQLKRSINYYGMAEMPGVVFAENTNGLLYPPSFADVIIRDPLTFEALPNGKVGLVQVFSPVPQSFPGHALLTEDLGVIEETDNGPQGWQGKALRIQGRVPKAELRGCSDVISESL